MSTLKMIAQEVGVQQSTVSRILNGKTKTYKYSSQTINKVREVARQLGYQPNAAARALVTKRSGNIGFILSDDVQGGWGNMYFARHLAGAERGCRQHGYGLNICLYNLSNLKDFVFPPSVGQRSVDGIILCGPTTDSVLEMFNSNNIPVISLGDNLDSPGKIPHISADAAGGYMKAAEFAAQKGYKKMLLCVGNKTSTLKNVNDLRQKMAQSALTRELKLDVFVPPHGLTDYRAATPLFEYWRQSSSDERADVILSSDQTMGALARELILRGIKCPQEVGLISGSDTDICNLSLPSLTALSHNIEGLAEAAVSMLVNNIERGDAISPCKYEKATDISIIQREST